MVVADPAAVKYILQAAGNTFVKPRDAEKLAEMTFGQGLFWAPSGS